MNDEPERTARDLDDMEKYMSFASLDESFRPQPPIIVVNADSFRRVLLAIREDQMSNGRPLAGGPFDLAQRDLETTLDEFDTRTSGAFKSAFEEQEKKYRDDMVARFSRG